MRRRLRAPGEQWESAARDALRRFGHLDDAGRARVLDQARELDGTRSWEPLGDLELTAAMRAAIAAPACVLTAEIGLHWFSDVSAILIEPTSTIRATRHDLGGGIISEGNSHVLGQALIHGPVRLAWDEVESDRHADAAKSVVLHEFAHKLDMSDGVVDGTPNIRTRAEAQVFVSILDATLDDIRDGRHTGPIRSYGGTSRSELFAVATEAFFLAGRELMLSDPDLYDALQSFYLQHPA